VVVARVALVLLDPAALDSVLLLDPGVFLPLDPAKVLDLGKLHYEFLVLLQTAKDVLVLANLAPYQVDVVLEVLVLVL
jgi:hypothetical protein